MRDTRELEATGARPMDVAPGHLLVTPMSGRGMSEAGIVSHLATGEHGLAVQVFATLSSPERWDAQRVWVSTRTAERLLVFPAIAEHREGQLELSGITSPVEERRRRCIRVRTRLDVTISRVGLADEPISGHTLDLSRLSCRVKVPSAVSLVPGADVRTVLHIEDSPVVVHAHTTTVDVMAGETVLAFRSVSAHDLSRIDKHVMGCVFADAG